MKGQGGKKKKENKQKEKKKEKKKIYTQSSNILWFDSKISLKQISDNDKLAHLMKIHLL